ncbi:TIGR01548 family HAD-type hydrolase [Chamaesiphon sp.]|uniref:TIGR01548 family HAD-type hydrolase n=1 Tax=Chamaesiphon sp. TaxID=2814140 RepID=UPI0035944673
MSAIAIFDIDGVIRDVGNSYRRALADTVSAFTNGAYRPSAIEIDKLKGEGIWNNDWEGSQELIYRYFESQGQSRSELKLDYEEIVAYFQTKYRGTDPVNWNGYICDEPLLASLDYFHTLTAARISWGFFSGATSGSASYVLERRLGLSAPVLVAMEDAPGKPDPTGLLMVVERLGTIFESARNQSIVYVGDTVADMHTIVNARTKPAAISHHQKFIGVGVLPPHILADRSQIDSYRHSLLTSGAAIVLDTVTELTPALIDSL